MALITYADKQIGDTFSAAEATEIKTVVNTNAGSLLVLGDLSSNAYPGDKGKTAYDHSQVVTGNPHGTTINDIANLAKKLKQLQTLAYAGI